MVSRLFTLAAICGLLIAAVPPQIIRTANISHYIGNDRWDWTVFIQAPQEVLNTISYVEYTLHPTFPDPIRRVYTTTDSRYPLGSALMAGEYLKLVFA